MGSPAPTLLNTTVNNSSGASGDFEIVLSGYSSLAVGGTAASGSIIATVSLAAPDGGKIPIADTGGRTSGLTIGTTSSWDEFALPFDATYSIHWVTSVAGGTCSLWVVGVA